MDKWTQADEDALTAMLKRREAWARAKKFQHDCEHCKFLGRDEATDSDLYFCRQGNWIPTVVARYGNEGGEYHSGLYLRDSEYPQLAKAKRLAVQAGYLASEQP